MAEILCAGTIWSESEFAPVEVHYGKCGWNMQAALQSWATQQYHSTNNAYLAALKADRCDLSGASNMGQQRAQALADGFRVDYLPTNTSMSQATWRAFLLAHLPTAAVGIEVANGKALRDELTGQGEDASNLAYHFVTVFGHHDGGHSARVNRDLPPGWWVADGDNYVNNTHTASGWDRHLGGHTLCFYPETVMNAARPCAALAMYPRVLIAEAKPGGTQVAWTKAADGSYHDDKGHTAGNGIGNFLAAHNLLGSDGLAGEIAYTGSDSFLPLSSGTVVTAHKAADGTWSERADEGAALALSFYQEIQTLKHSAPTPPASAPADPLAAKALAVVQELGALLKEF